MSSQLNSLVESYREGNKLALVEIFEHINPLIEKASKEIEMIVEDVTKFDCRMILKAKKLIEETFNDSKGDFISVFKTTISLEKADFIKRRSRKLKETSLDALASGSEDGMAGYQFEASDDVESEVLLKEKVALLAQGDSRKKVILTEWSKGANDKAISELLAQLYGGTAESNRVYISRFKTRECRPFFEKELGIS